MDLPATHAAALAATRRVVAGFGDVDWSAPTPCDDWDLRTLANHVIAGNWWAAELGSGRTIDEVGDRLDGDVIGDDVLSAYDASARAASQTFEAEGAMEAPCAVSYGPVPGSVYCGHRVVDVVVHGWDLAVATGQPATIEPALAEACLDIVRPQLDQLVASDMFGERHDAPPGAGPAEELLAMLGRA